jgi:hypothetical protein
MATAPHQSIALAAVLALPPAVPVGGSNVQSCVCAEDYHLNVKRLRIVGPATTADLEASKESNF